MSIPYMYVGIRTSYVTVTTPSCSVTAQRERHATSVVVFVALPSRQRRRQEDEQLSN